jgi:cytochrome c556
MNRLTRWQSAVIVGCLAAMIVVGLAAAQSSPKVMSGDIVTDRQRLMKLNGASWADTQAKFKAGNIEAIAVNAETMAVMASHVPTLFPQGSLTEKSNAKPEIWQKWDEFVGAARSMEAWAEKLRDTAKTKDAAATEAIVKDFGRQACGSCHTLFRLPPRN